MLRSFVKVGFEDLKDKKLHGSLQTTLDCAGAKPDPKAAKASFGIKGFPAIDKTAIVQKVIRSELLGRCLQLSFYHIARVGNTPARDACNGTGHKNAQVTNIFNRSWGNEATPSAFRQEIRVEVSDDSWHISDSRRKQTCRQSF